METAFFQVIFFVLGLCVGSFVNMAVFRYALDNKLESPKSPKSRKVQKTRNSGRSYCDGCGRQLRWLENIPVVSWVIQGGKARCCQTPLPLQYPMVEFGTGILFLINLQTSIFPPEADFASLRNFHFFLILLMIGIIVFATVVDLKYMILPDGATVALIILALLMGVNLDKILAGIIGVAFLGGLHLITRGKGMGLGDVKLALFMGLLLGIKGLVIAFYVAFIAGAVAGVVMLALNKKKLKSPIPFGPFLFLGTLVVRFLMYE